MKTILFNKEYQLEALQYIFGANGLPDGRSVIEDEDFIYGMVPLTHHNTTWQGTYCTTVIT